MAHDPTFGEFLRKTRLEKGLRLRDFADEIRCSVAYVSDVERGTRAPFSDQDVVKIAKKLGMDETELLRMAHQSQSRFVLAGQMTQTKREFAAKLEQIWESMDDTTVRSMLELFP